MTGKRDRGSSGAVKAVILPYGIVEDVAGFTLFYLLVDRLTPTVVAGLELRVPDLVPEPVTTGLAMLLWLFFGAIVIGGAIGTLRENSRRFANATNRAEFLEAARPSTPTIRRGTFLLIAGAVTVAFT